MLKKYLKYIRPPHMLFPFVYDMKEYTVTKFKADFVAGITVAIVGTPQAIAYAVIAGVDPRYGLYACIVPVIIAALMGSSRFLVAGPTNTVSMVIFSVISTATIGGVVISEWSDADKIKIVFTISVIAGLFQVIFGLVRAGSLLNFISHSVIVGFTAGAGILIGVNQIKNLLGLYFDAPSAFIESTIATIKHVPEFDWRALLLGLFTIVFIVVSKKIAPKFPSSLIALIVSSFVVAFAHWDGDGGVATVGYIPRTLPPLSAPTFSLDVIRSLIMPSFAIAVLGVVEAYSIAKSFSAKAGDKMNGNQEFIGQGLANISAGFFSGIPGTGSFTRSAVNFSSHAATRFSALFSAFLVLSILLLFADGARFIPIASLAGILMVIAFSMIDRHAFMLAFRATVSDRVVVVVTMLSTLILHLEEAIYVGVALSVILFLRKVSHPSIFQVTPNKDTRKLVAVKHDMVYCPEISIYQVDGSLFFGAVNEIEDKISHFMKNGGRILIIRLAHVRLIDATGVHALESLHKEANARNITMMFTNIKKGPRKVLWRTGMEEKIGSENFFEHTNDAIQEAIRRVQVTGKCAQCSLRPFLECGVVKKK